MRLTAEDALGLYNNSNGTNYPKIPRLPIPEMGDPVEVPSATTPGRKYTVTQDNTGALRCTCPGFGYRRQCHHVDVITELLTRDQPKDKDLVEL